MYVYFLVEITVASTSSFHSNTGYHIIKVNEQEIALPPDTHLNIIMITVGLLILVGVIIAYIVLTKIYG